MDKIEIKIPAGASEVTLKTAGKYCDKDIKVTSFVRTVKGRFTPDANYTDSYTIPGIPTDCRFVEISHISSLTPVEQADMKTATIPVTYAEWFGSVSGNVKSTLGMIEYELIRNDDTINYGANKATAVLSEDGLTFTMNTIVEGYKFAFEADKTYEWTAYYWDE